MVQKIEQIITANPSGFVRGVNQASAALNQFEGQLKGFQSVAVNALSFAGIGIGAVEIIQLADAYGQMTGRLKLATQFSGDFAQIQEDLRNSSRATRADLGATVNLYTQLAPSLKGVGMSGKETVGIITTINKAIGLSGASAQAAEAALLQLGQGFAGGALRGEELNSIMEQTPALAQAIADGLGVSRGELRKMGEEGKLTAEVVAKALQNVSEQIDKDFAQVPVTVGQALTNLKNEFLIFVGETDKAAGGTSALAQGINMVADEFKNAGPIVTGFSVAIKSLVSGLDAINRMFKIIIAGLGAYSAAFAMAIQGNFSQAREVLNLLGKDVDAILQKPSIDLFGAEQEKSEKAVDVTKKRIQLEQQLADEVVKLEKLKAYEAGQASDNIAKKESENIKARIADQQKLVDAVRAAFQESLKEAEKYAAEAQKKLVKATDYRQAGQDSAFNASIRGLSSEDQAAAKAARLNDVASQASTQAAQARLAAYEGNLKKYETLATAAEKKLQAALKLAEDVGDVTSIENISGELAQLQEVGAGLDKQKQAEAEQRAQSQAELLKNLQAQLDAMTAQARTIEVQAEVTQAQTAIAGLKAQLDEIKDKTVTVTVQQTTAGAAPGYYTGGLIRGPGTGTSDSILARLSNGEYVVKAAAVSHYGANLLNRINSMSLPKFATGGLVGGSKSSGTSLVLDFGKLGRYNAQASQDTADSIALAFKRAALARGKR